MPSTRAIDHRVKDFELPSIVSSPAGPFHNYVDVEFLSRVLGALPDCDPEQVIAPGNHGESYVSLNLAGAKGQEE